MDNKIKCPHCGNEHAFTLHVYVPVQMDLERDGTVSLESYTYNHSTDETLIEVFEHDEKEIENRNDLFVICGDCYKTSFPVLDYANNYCSDDIARVLTLFKTRKERDTKSDGVRLLRKISD